MTPVILKKPQAEIDLVEIYTYLAERNPRAAESFLTAAEAAFSRLARLPGIGRIWESDSARLAGVRSWTIPRFSSYRIFYRPVEDGIEVLHVFHAKRDIKKLLEEDES